MCPYQKPGPLGRARGVFGRVSAGLLGSCSGSWFPSCACCAVAAAVAGFVSPRTLVDVPGLAGVDGLTASGAWIVSAGDDGFPVSAGPVVFGSVSGSVAVRVVVGAFGVLGAAASLAQLSAGQTGFGWPRHC